MTGVKLRPNAPRLGRKSRARRRLAEDVGRAPSQPISRPVPGAAATRWLLDAQTQVGNRAVVQLLHAQRSTKPTSPAPQVVQRAPNWLRHRGRWGAIDDPTILGLWAKGAAFDKLWTGPTVRAMQESPNATPDHVDQSKRKLRELILHSTDEFEGTNAARQDAAETLEMRWPLIAPEVLEKLTARYQDKFLEAFSNTPPGTELVTRPEDFVRIRYAPHGESAYTGYGHDMLHPGEIRGDREILDIKGCGSLENCGKEPTDIWFIRQRDPSWIYWSNSHKDSYDWHVAGIAREVADSTQLAAEFFPLLLKIGGFSLGLSSRIAVLIAAEVLSALGEQGVRSARGEEMQSAMEILKSAGMSLFIAKVTGHMFGGHTGGELKAELDEVAEHAAGKARQEVARTDAAVVERELQAGKAKAVEGHFADEGYRTEVEVVSEGQTHVWRRKADGTWCRFSEEPPLCIVTFPGGGVERAVAEHPPKFERDLAAAGVSTQARNRLRNVLGKDTLSVEDLIAKNPAAAPMTTEWIRVRGALTRADYEERVWLASEYGVSDYVRYHIRAPGLGGEGFPIPLARTWMNHGANEIETFMRARLSSGWAVRFRVTRATFGPDELRPFFDSLVRSTDKQVLGRIALDGGRVERWLKSITYEINTYRTVGGRGMVERWGATMEAGIPPAGAVINRGLPLTRLPPR